MMTIKPARENLLVLAFDGCVREVFRVNGSSRLPVALLDKVELKTGKQGARTVAINVLGACIMAVATVDEQGCPALAPLVEEVQQAKAQFVMDR